MSSLEKAGTQHSHLQGLVEDGRPNLGLFNQLYWTILCSFLLVLHAIFPLPHLIRCLSRPYDFPLKKLVTLDLHVKILTNKNSNTCNDSMTQH